VTSDELRNGRYSNVSSDILRVRRRGSSTNPTAEDSPHRRHISDAGAGAGEPLRGFGYGSAAAALTTWQQLRAEQRAAMGPVAACVGWSDLYHVPTEGLRPFVELASLFQRHAVFHEVAVPTILHLLASSHGEEVLETCVGCCCCDVNMTANPEPDAANITRASATGEDRNTSRAPHGAWPAPSTHCAHRIDLTKATVRQAVAELLASA